MMPLAEWQRLCDISISANNESSHKLFMVDNGARGRMSAFEHRVQCGFGHVHLCHGICHSTSTRSINKVPR